MTERRTDWGTNAEQNEVIKQKYGNRMNKSHNKSVNIFYLWIKTVNKLNWSKHPGQCAFTHLSCMPVWERVELTVVHEAIVAEPYAQHHSVLSGRAVSLGNQVNDAHSRSDTMPVYTFSYKAHRSTAGLRLSVCSVERRWWFVSQHVLINMCITGTMIDCPRLCSSWSLNGEKCKITSI